MIDPLTIRPADIEEARQEVRRLDDRLRKSGNVAVPKDKLEEEGSALTDLAKELNDGEGKLLHLRGQIRKRQMQIQFLTLGLHFWQALQSRHMPATLWLGGLSITALFGACAGVVGRPALAALVCLIGICIISLAFILLYYANIDTQKRLDNVSKRVADAKMNHACLAAEVQLANETVNELYRLWQAKQARYEYLCNLYDLWCRYNEASQRYQALLEIVNSRRYQLSRCNWRAMRGTDFETFLQDVFEVLGYSVQTTKKSGDQGIDLIVTGKGRRIGVQAKGYADKVGNHSVMEAHAGRDFYNCDSCVVITNSDFTRTAEELAGTIKCMLIAGGDIPNLISGNIL